MQVGSIQLFRAYVFDARDKSFLLPMLRSDWQAVLSASPAHLSWALWNSHTLRHLMTSSDVIRPRDPDITEPYMTCCAENYTIHSVITGTELASMVNGLMNNHEVRAVCCIRLLEVHVC